MLSRGQPSLIGRASQILFIIIKFQKQTHDVKTDGIPTFANSRMIETNEIVDSLLSAKRSKI